jgi:uncharacterized protein YndB with AHSA1/START domain
MADDVIHDTFVIERHYPKPPAKVFAAFSDPARKRRWFAEGATQVPEDFVMEFRVGGREMYRSTMSDQTPFPGVVLMSEGTYHDIAPDRRIVIAATMTLGERRISTSLLTFEIQAAGEGTDLRLTHQAVFFEGSDGPQMRQGGWRSLLDNLAAEVGRS